MASASADISYWKRWWLDPYWVFIKKSMRFYLYEKKFRMLLIFWFQLNFLEAVGFSHAMFYFRWMLKMPLHFHPLEIPRLSLPDNFSVEKKAFLARLRRGRFLWWLGEAVNYVIPSPMSANGQSWISINGRWANESSKTTERIRKIRPVSGAFK